LVQELVHRQQDLDTLITDETDAYKQELLINERRGIKNYLGCVDEQPDNDGRCLGLACSQIKACDDYKADDRNRCKALGKIRAALRCRTLPCLQAAEDGRLFRIFKDAAGPPHTDPDYPG
jgi:hypothetical protein